jgi:hypothetical protein
VDDARQPGEVEEGRQGGGAARVRDDDDPGAETSCLQADPGERVDEREVGPPAAGEVHDDDVAPGFGRAGAGHGRPPQVSRG